MTRANRVLAAACLAIVVGVVSCGGDETTAPPPQAASVEVAPASETLAAIGATVQFTATAKDGSGNDMSGKTFTWASTSTAAATVSESGLATAVANGTTTIRASVDGVSGTAALTVAQVVTSVSVSPARDTLTAFDDTSQLQATPKDSRGNAVAGATVSWESSDETVAEVDATGLVTALANGAATITATSNGVEGSGTILVDQQGALLAVATQPVGAVVDQPLSTQPVVEVHDARGNLVTDDNSAVVTASIATGGGTLQGTAAMTAVGGVVTYTDLTILQTAGSKTLAFSAPGLPDATSASFTVAPGPPVELTLEGGNSQTAPAATQLPSPLTVKVADSYGNGVPAYDVGWTVTSGSGNLGSATTATDALGVATNTYVLGRYAAVETIDAATAGLTGSPINFSATATPNGTISGTVTLSNALLAPPADATRVAVGVGRAPGYRSKIVLPLLASSGFSALPPVREQQPEFVSDELIVTFRASSMGLPSIGAQLLAAPATAERTSQAIRTALATRFASAEASVTGVAPAILAARIKVADPLTLNQVASQLRADPAVAAVERNAITWREPTPYATAAVQRTLSNDPYYPWQAWHYEMVDAPEAWATETGSSSILVAVVDDGTRFDHPDMAGRLSSDGFDFVSLDHLVNVCGLGLFWNSGDTDGPDADPTNPFAGLPNLGLGCYDPNPAGNHGLHVAGTIGAAGNNGVWGTGVNWNVTIRPIRVIGIDGTARDFDIIQGLLYAAGVPVDTGGGLVQAPSPAPIINMSLKAAAPSTALENAVITATNQGSLIIAAAGNDNSSAPIYPAAYPQTLSVSAVGPDLNRASYSSYGSTVDISAPGGDFPDGGYNYTVWSTAWDYTSNTPVLAASHGTSMAAPHVSGVAALVLAASPGLSNSQLRARLENYAIDIGAAGRDDQYGHGLLNARNSITQSLAPPQNLYAALIDANSGAILAGTQAAPDGSFAFTELMDGNYVVFAGQDANGDLAVGTPVRRWGALGGTATPATVVVDGAGNYGSDFTVGFPTEIESNGTFPTADVLLVGGYLLGTISNPATDVDVSVVQIPASDTYTFETAAMNGACGFALEEDTILALYLPDGTLIASNDDIDFGAAQLCSRISTTLAAGTYYLEVTGYNGGRYAVSARQGS